MFTFFVNKRFSRKIRKNGLRFLNETYKKRKDLFFYGYETVFLAKLKKNGNETVPRGREKRKHVFETNTAMKI